jgi:hypothetical protein
MFKIKEYKTMVKIESFQKEMERVITEHKEEQILQKKKEFETNLKNSLFEDLNRDYGFFIACDIYDCVVEKLTEIGSSQTVGFYKKLYNKIKKETFKNIPDDYLSECVANETIKQLQSKEFENLIGFSLAENQMNETFINPYNLKLRKDIIRLTVCNIYASLYYAFVKCEILQIEVYESTVLCVRHSTLQSCWLLTLR